MSDLGDMAPWLSVLSLKSSFMGGGLQEVALVIIDRRRQQFNG